MMRLLLHGPAKSASRKKLIELKGKYDPNNVVVVENGTDSEKILGQVRSQPLFGEEQLVIIENPGMDLAQSLKGFEQNIILWFDSETDLKKWPDFEVLFFPEGREVSVFPFLDLLGSKSPKAHLEMQRLKNAGFDFYYLLTMVFYFLRSLSAIPKKAPDFVKRKLTRQLAVLGEDKIPGFYKDMLEIDFKIKSGLLEKEQAEFLLMQKFLV